MYSGSGYSDWEIGDVTMIIDNGVYHLFHLIIPNHDYIAHAVSTDGISWKRVSNALFVGEPGEWDDDMLWTMHVCKQDEKFRMYYTGLRRKDKGVVTRIGIAESDDLLKWVKVKHAAYPLGPSDGTDYESLSNNPRNWLSFRDPFFMEVNQESYMLLCARVGKGPVSRRGCVGLFKWSGERYLALPPLMHPMAYDDVECPCGFELDGKYYLIGSIREDVKVRYWFADKFLGEYHCFHADVLMPQGNYAARILKDNDHLLIYNFFYTHGQVNSLRVFPPPKELGTDGKGRLVLKSYYRWDEMASQPVSLDSLGHPIPLFENPTNRLEFEDGKWTCGARSGYDIFWWPRPSANYIWEGRLKVEGMGKFGLTVCTDEEANGYYISFDLINGLVQFRAWGYNANNQKKNFVFENIQSNTITVPHDRAVDFRLIVFGNYLELSVDGVVKITLIDYQWSGSGLGLYSASSIISLQESTIRSLPAVIDEYASQEEAEKKAV